MNNQQKRTTIQATLAEYTAKFAALKRRRDGIIAGFIEALRQRQIGSIRDLLKKL